MEKIQYISDIHLETRSNESKNLFEKILKPSAPYLALCGDIGYPGAQLYEPFLKYCSDNFEHVFYVPGNHEYYNDLKAIKYLKNKRFIEGSVPSNKLREISAKFPRESQQERIEKIREICKKFPNIHFLNKETYQITNTNIIIVGCTLWSKLDMKPHKLPNFNDFHMICEDKDTLLTPKTYNDWNEEDIKFLNETLPKISNMKIIILTHHCPTYDVIIDKYRLDDPDNMNSFFANKDLIEKNIPLDSLKGHILWICGHTHGCNKINMKVKNLSMVIATNTYGYESETVEGFCSAATLDLN